MYGDSPNIVSYSVVQLIIYLLIYLFQNLTLRTIYYSCKNDYVILYVEFSCTREYKQAGQRWTQETLRRTSGDFLRHASKTLTLQIRTTNSFKEGRVQLYLVVPIKHRDNDGSQMPVRGLC